MSDPQPQPDTKAAIIEWLQLRGYRDEEVAKIMAKLAAHDDQTAHASVFDSIGGGTMTLDDIIREALAN